ncbi:hypothetical protein ACWIGM_08755 [Bosea sp. NPDC055332]
MSTMIERVVAANKRAWDEWPEPITTANLAQVRVAAARAAIAEMREPTEGMSEALSQATYEECGYPSDWMEIDAPTVFAAIISAALEEKP